MDDDDDLEIMTPLEFMLGATSYWVAHFPHDWRALGYDMYYMQRVHDLLDSYMMEVRDKMRGAVHQNRQDRNVLYEDIAGLAVRALKERYLLYVSAIAEDIQELRELNELR